jgi:site-specific DNA-cytosine methylase
LSEQAGTLKKRYNDNSPHIIQFIEEDTHNSIQGEAGKPGGGKGYLGSEELAFTLSRHPDQNIMQQVNEEEEISNESKPAQQKILIRRLTPKETLRLQGFPDDYLINAPGYSDSKAYAAVGNSMTTQVMQWIGQRIHLVDSAIKELAQRTEP